NAPASSGYTGPHDVRIQVDGTSGGDPGERDWLVRLFNPGVLSVPDAALVVCLPPGWLLQAPGVFMSTLAGDPGCRRLALGALAARKETKVEFKTVRWPPASRALPVPPSEAVMDLYVHGVAAYQG